MKLSIRLDKALCYRVKVRIGSLAISKTTNIILRRKSLVPHFQEFQTRRVQLGLSYCNWSFNRLL